MTWIIGCIALILIAALIYFSMWRLPKLTFEWHGNKYRNSKTHVILGEYSPFLGGFRATIYEVGSIGTAPTEHDARLLIEKYPHA